MATCSFLIQDKNASRALRDVKSVKPLQVAGVEGYRFERRDGSQVVVVFVDARTGRIVGRKP